MVNDVLQLRSTEGTIALAEEMTKPPAQERWDDKKVHIYNMTQFAFNRTDFANLLSDLRTMRKRLRELGVETSYRTPKRYRTRLSDPPIPKFVREPFEKRNKRQRVRLKDED